MINLATPEQYRILRERSSKISRFGVVRFALLAGSALFLSMTAFTILETWLTLRAHHLQYNWNEELSPSSITSRAFMLAISLALPLIYWFAVKMHIARYEKNLAS